MGKAYLVQPSSLQKHCSIFSVSSTEYGLGMHFKQRVFLFPLCIAATFPIGTGSASIVTREQWKNKPKPHLLLFTCQFLFSKLILTMLLKDMSVSGKWLSSLRVLCWNLCSSPAQAGKPCLTSFPKPCLPQRKVPHLLGENSRPTCHHSFSPCF